MASYPDAAFPERAAESCLRRALGRPALLREPQLIREGGRNRVWRFRTDDPALPSVVLKQMGTQEELGFTDWACLEFLSRAPGLEGVVPRFLGGDPDARLFLMEDLGDSSSLDTLLADGSPETVESALAALAIATARLHFATAGREAEFVRLRAALPGPAPHRGQEAERWLSASPRLLEWLEAAGCSPPEGLSSALEAVARCYAGPGPFLALTHGDMAPSNNHVCTAGVTLLDFEYGAYRHALYDLTAWQILCPMPRRLVSAMFRSYLAALRARDARFPLGPELDDGWAAMCAYRTVAMLQWIAPSVLQKNRSWVREWTAREAVVAALERLLECPAVPPELEPLWEAASRLRARLRQTWPEYLDPIPAWPVLQPSGSPRS